MRRIMVLLAVIVMTLAMTAGVAQGHEEDVPEHPHALLLNFEFSQEDGVSFDKCIDLADNRPLPHVAHHHSIHTGTAGVGDPSVGITRAGHLVVPLAPFPGSPFASCGDIEAFVS